MQAKRKLLPILLVLIAAALFVSACGGGAAGRKRPGLTCRQRRSMSIPTAL